jgi:hypothetical protein
MRKAAVEYKVLLVPEFRTSKTCSCGIPAYVNLNRNNPGQIAAAENADHFVRAVNVTEEKCDHK